MAVPLEITVTQVVMLVRFRTFFMFMREKTNRAKFALQCLAQKK